MWVSDDTDFSDGSMNDKTFTLTVNVYADGKVVTDNLDTTNTLDSITVSDCTLDPAFNSATTEYSCTVKNNISTVNVNATAAPSTAANTIIASLLINMANISLRSISTSPFLFSVSISLELSFIICSLSQGSYAD